MTTLKTRKNSTFRTIQRHCLGSLWWMNDRRLQTSGQMNQLNHKDYFSSLAVPQPRLQHPDKKENWAWERLFPQKRECRSTSARLSANPCRQKFLPRTQYETKTCIEKKLSSLVMTTVHTQWYVFETACFTRLIQTGNKTLRNKKVNADVFYWKGVILIFTFLFKYWI